MNFLIGGLAGCFATCVIQPVDYVKVQIQIRSEMGPKGGSLGPIAILKETIAKQGARTLYAGLDSALLRQVLYTSTRLGVFYQLTDRYNKKNNKKPPFLTNVFFSILCGAVGATVGNPADLCLIRMQADSNLPPEQRRNYKNVVDALSRTVKEEGFFSLWRGSGPTVIRAMVMNFALLVPFEETKKLLIPYVDSTRMRSIYAAMVAGALGSFLSLPFDNVKTKLQKMKKNPDGTYPYKGVLDAIVKTANNEGYKKLWVGLNTFYWRIAPHVIITFVTVDALRNVLGVTAPAPAPAAAKK
jgi:solute carrier family 25 oxoglutarate transporter 11